MRESDVIYDTPFNGANGLGEEHLHHNLISTPIKCTMDVRREAHMFGRDMHVVGELEIRQKRDPLTHAHVPEAKHAGQPM